MGVLDKFLDIMKLSDDDEYDEDDFFDDDEYDDEYEEKPKKSIFRREKTHDESEEECGIMGKGAMIGIAPSLSREMSDSFISLAEEKGIPYQLEVMSGKTGTNADTIGVSGSGTKTVTVSIPEKHMHTPVEIVDINDIDNTALLIAEYLKRV